MQSASFNVVVTWSKAGIAEVSCLAKGLDNSTGGAVHYDAYNNPLVPDQVDVLLCSISYGNQVFTTDQVKETVSASGNANLKCHFEDVDAP